MCSLLLQIAGSSACMAPFTLLAVIEGCFSWTQQRKLVIRPNLSCLASGHEACSEGVESVLWLFCSSDTGQSICICICITPQRRCFNLRPSFQTLSKPFPCQFRLSGCVSFNNNSNNNNHNPIERHNSRLLQSPHCTTNCFQHVRSSGKIVCK